MPRLIRREPVIERIKAFLNPLDFLLWLSEELDTNGWDQLEKEWAIPIGLVLNLLFLIARANSKSREYDDVFGDDTTSYGWLSWVASFLVHFLTLLSSINAIYTFWRKKHYRLFETAVDAFPRTPSAHRVRVDSSPVSSSPLQFLSSILGTENARMRAHPDPERDVWQIAIWDPLPLCLRLFCYFSPGHVLIYLLFLPTSATDTRPSATVCKTIMVAILLSGQLVLLQSNFSQQGKDTALISKEMLHEYDTKYVHPRTQPLYRDVATQFTEQASFNGARDEKYNTVDTYTPIVVINRGFKPNPNPNYSRYTNPDGLGGHPSIAPREAAAPTMTPGSQVTRTPTHLTDSSSPLRPRTAIRQPVFRPNSGSAASDGGSLGIYSHAASPLRKSASTKFDRNGEYTIDYIRERTSFSPEKRPSSPNKRLSVPSSGINTPAATQRRGHLKATIGERENGRL